jgi:hypothetical protein
MPLKLREEERQKLFETNEAAAPLLDLVSAYVFRMASTASSQVGGSSFTLFVARRADG